MTEEQIEKLKIKYKSVYLLTLRREFLGSRTQELLFTSTKKPYDPTTIEPSEDWNPMWEIENCEPISWGEAALFDVWPDDTIINSL